MSKELEALKTIGDLDYIDEYDHRNGSLKQHFGEEFTTIEKGLQRLEQIDNANPSEALNLLEYICDILKEKHIDIKWLFKNDYNTIKQALIKAQEMEKELADVEMVKSGKTIIHIGKDLVMMNKAKYKEYAELENEPVSKRILQAKCEEQEKVLKVISKKTVGIFQLRCCKNVNEYNDLKFYDSEKLTEEEFKLLKRWCDEKENR